MISGKVGARKIIWKDTPKGKLGEGVVSVDGREVVVRWVRDDQGIWIETDKGFFGYDARKHQNDDGQTNYLLLKRNQAKMVASTGLLKAGEEQDSSSGKVKKIAKTKSQMPGKIVRILVKAGDKVKKGQSLLVMEAMKMENEIKAGQDTTVKEIKVVEGQAIETGAELITFG